jgi:carboxyl-terminal processing protease
MQENNKTNWAGPLKYAIILFIGIVLGIFLKGNLSLNSSATNGAVPVQEIIELVKSKYVDKIANDSADLRFINNYLAELDPHSVYITPSELTEVNEQLMSNFKGIGIEFQQVRDSIYVAYVMKDGPADKAGLKVGDILLKANDTMQLSGKKWEPEAIRSNLKGPAESKIKLLVLSGKSTKTITIQRDNIPTSAVDASYQIKPGVGYIKINKFADRTYEAFMQALEPLIKDSIKSLVIDLRGNPGGILSEAVAIADELIPGNKLLVYTQGEHAPRTDYFSKREGLFEQGNIVVWMDESSASASEVLAGALQDWDRATIIGRPSFGKGLVQQQFKLSNGGALRLTIAKYYTPLGRNIQRSFEKGKQAYEHDYVNRIEDNAAGKKDSIFKGKAFKTPKGKTVYGGGGIFPDAYVAGSTIILDSVYGTLLEDNLMNDFVMHWYLKEQNKMKAFKNTAEYIKSYQSVDIWTALVQFASPAQKNILKSLEKNKPYIQNQVLALLARMQWHKQGYYEVLNQLDGRFIAQLP